MQHSLNGGGGSLTYRIHSLVGGPSLAAFTKLWRGPITYSIHWEGAPLMCSIHSMVEGGSLTCSIHSMVEGDPSHTGFTHWWGAPHLQHSLNYGEDPLHTAFTGREHPSCVAFTQWLRGDPSHAAFTQWWRGPLTLIQILTHVTNSPPTCK